MSEQPWTPPPDAADQLSEPSSGDGEAAAKNVYNQGVIKAMQAILASINEGADIEQIRESAERMIAHLEDEETERRFV